MQRKMVIAVAVSLLMGIFGVGFYKWKVARQQSDIQYITDTSHHHDVYSCSMHPSIVSDHPGTCPICKMDLQKIESEVTKESAGASRSEKRPIFYRHPMRGDITSPVPAKDEMGMDYIPVYEDEETTELDSGVQGRASFTLPKYRQQQIGVTRAKVEKKQIYSVIKAAGKIAFDPDLYTALDEYRQAVISAESLKNSSYSVIKDQAEQTIESAKTKLRLLGLGDGQIRKILTSKTADISLLLPKGQVWVYSEVFEYELPQVKENQQVIVRTSNLPGKTFSGKIVSIAPTVNPTTRTGRIRALVPDREGLLRPDSFVEVEIRADLGKRTVVPNESILHSGSEDFVFVISGDSFVPRPVVLGVRTGDEVEVTSGIDSGEEVVTSANFLIDSESRLRSVVKGVKSQRSNSATDEVNSGSGSGTIP